MKKWSINCPREMECFDNATVDDSDTRRGRRGVPTRMVLSSKITMDIFIRSIGDNCTPKDQGENQINKYNTDLI